MISNEYKVNEVTNVFTTNMKITFAQSYLICLYVDNLLKFGSKICVVNYMKSLLRNNIDMKDLGEADVILGIKINITEKEIFLDQSHYVERI
jgi:hypothetical protein